MKLLAFIGGLLIASRQVITVAFEELPLTEIAEVLGFSENNVSVCLARARKILRERLAGN